MADEAEEMLEILFKQIRKLARDLDSFRRQLQNNRDARMPRSLMEEIRNIQQQHEGVDRVTSQRPPTERYAQFEREVQALRQQEADLRRELDDRQRELEANQDLNRDGNPDNSVDDRDERDEVTDDVDERDEQEQQDERERDEQEQREREEEERRREEEEKRKREEEERKRQEEEKRETGTPNPQLPVGAAAAAAPALDDDFDQTAEQMKADHEADREQSRESMEAQRQEIAQQQAEQMENWDGLGNREAIDQMRTEAEQRGELPPRDVAEQVDEARNQQEQPDQAQAQDPQEQTQEQVREQQEREPQAQEDREQQAESVESAEQDGVDGDGPESRREQETERQEEDREQADVGTGEGFATGGDHQVADQAAEQAEQPDGRVQAVDQVLEQERLDRENQQGANPQEGSNRPGMSPDEIRQAQEKYSAGTSSPSGAVGNRPNGESLDGARGGQTAAQVHAKTTQRGGREQSGHELKKG